MKRKHSTALLAIAIAVFCILAAAQENTADSWLKKGYDLMAIARAEEVGYNIPV